MTTFTTDVLIIGSGPAGLFCADRIADQGDRKVSIIESGKKMNNRWCPETQACSCQSCYVLEGIGGAGGFSDGKLPFSLLRGTQLESIFDESMEPLLWEVDQNVVKHAGPGLWYDPTEVINPPVNPADHEMTFNTYPLRHVGSDGVRRWSSGMAGQIEEKGVDIYHNQTATLITRQDGWTVVTTKKGDHFMARQLVMATGIQGIPWSESVLRGMGVKLSVGAAGIGIRVETPAEDMAPLFDRFYDWKIVYEPEDSPIIARSFCCNQKGAIVNQWHRSMDVRGVNGHSSLDPEQRTNSSNFAIIAKIPEKGYVNDPQAYVRAVAQQVNSLSGGHPIVQWASAFLNLGGGSKVNATWRTNHQARDDMDIRRVMPFELADVFCQFIETLFDAVPSLDVDRAIVYAPEVKYPARRVPVNLKTWQLAGFPEIYVPGDASGYLDSFVAAAISGLAAANHITSMPAGVDVSKEQEVMVS